MLKAIRWTAIGLIVLLAAGWGTVWVAQSRPEGNAARLVRSVDAWLTGKPTGDIPSGALGGPFTLTDNKGRAVTDASFRGRWLLIYFGYTYCPDVCPTELQTIATAMDGLGPAAAKVVPIFITVDPARDTPQAIDQYVHLFDDRLIGLTGTRQQIDAVAREYRVYHAEKTEPGASSYLVDHSSFIYLVDPAGKVQALFQAGTNSSELISGISAKMSAGDR